MQLTCEGRPLPCDHVPCDVAVRAVMLVCGFVLAWQQFYDQDAAEEDEDLA